MAAVTACVLKGEHQRHMFITQAVLVFHPSFPPLAIVSFHELYLRGLFSKLNSHNCSALDNPEIASD